ncbi:MAG: hypothetical protein QXI61_01150 [Nitrososphaerota archaeon]
MPNGFVALMVMESRVIYVGEEEEEWEEEEWEEEEEFEEDFEEEEFEFEEEEEP